MTNTALARRHFLSTLSAGAVAATLPATRAHSADAVKSSATWPRYEAISVIDALGGPGNANKPDKPLDAEDLADVRASGLTAVNLTVGSVGSYARDYDGAIEGIAHWDKEIATHPDTLMKFSRIGDLAEAKRSRRLAIIYGFQDATPFGENLDRLDTFADLGVRIVQLTYNRRNLVGDGCLEPADAGLSLFGRELVERMNAREVLVDLSHCGHRTTDEAIEISKKSVAITHAGCAAVSDLPRNKTDATLRKLADRGGVVGIYLMPTFAPAASRWRPMSSRTSSMRSTFAARITSASAPTARFPPFVSRRNTRKASPTRSPSAESVASQRPARPRRSIPSCPISTRRAVSRRSRRSWPNAADPNASPRKCSAATFSAFSRKPGRPER